MLLDKSEVFVALVFEDFGEQRDVVVLLDVRLDTVDDGGGPLNDQGFQPIFLVQVGVHVLFEGLFAHSVLLALFVELDFLSVNVHDSVLQLLFCQNAVLCSTYGRS